MTSFTLNTTTVDLPHSIITPYADNEDLEHESIITGVRNFIPAKDHEDYLVTVYLFKYDDPEAQLDYLKTFENQQVKLFSTHDKITVWNEPVSFFLESVTPFFLDNAERYGACNLLFRSIETYSEEPLTGYGFNYGEM